MSILFGRGFAAALLVAGLAGPACAQGSGDLTAGGVGVEDSGASVDTGLASGDSAMHDGGMHSDASASADAGTGTDTGVPLADASSVDASTLPDASSPDTGTVQPDASTAPIQCPTDTLHSAEAAVELAKPMPKTCILPAQCSPGECCFVPFVCIPL